MSVSGYYKNKKIEHLILRYYDDYAMYFNSESAAQIALTGLKSILNDFELKVNDEKIHIKKSQNELETEWALAIKSFYHRPFENDQKEDLKNLLLKKLKLNKIKNYCMTLNMMNNNR